MSDLDLAELERLAEAATVAIAEPPGYKIDRDGRVWSMSGWRGCGRRELAQCPNSHGYPSVRVSYPDGRRRRLLVHSLVAVAFLPPRPSPAHEVRHLDGNKTNNHVSNLAWGTRKENAADRDRHGRTARGDRNGSRLHPERLARGDRNGMRIRVHLKGGE